MTWDKQVLKSEIEAYENNHFINWRELATRYKVCNRAGQIASNGGQMVKDWLISEGVDLSRFRTKRECSIVVRREKIRGIGGEITFPP